MLRTLLATVAATLLFAACGTDSGTTATDPGPTETESSTEPTPAPTVGTYPPFEPEDYTFQLVVSCFCADGGAPIKVTVVEAVVVDAIYLGDGRGVQEGQQADEYRWLTINDVIDAANDTGAAQVVVHWPAGQDYPSSVSVDQDLNMVDEEITYQVSDVTTTG